MGYQEHIYIMASYITGASEICLHLYNLMEGIAAEPSTSMLIMTGYNMDYNGGFDPLNICVLTQYVGN